MKDTETTRAIATLRMKVPVEMYTQGFIDRFSEFYHGSTADIFREVIITSNHAPEESLSAIAELLNAAFDDLSDGDKVTLREWCDQWFAINDDTPCNRTALVKHLRSLLLIDAA